MEGFSDEDEEGISKEEQQEVTTESIEKWMSQLHVSDFFFIQRTYLNIDIENSTDIEYHLRSSSCVWFCCSISS